MAWPTPASYAGGLEKEEEWKRAEIKDKGSVKREKSSLRQRKRVNIGKKRRLGLLLSSKPSLISEAVM